MISLEVSFSSAVPSSPLAKLSGSVLVFLIAVSNIGIPHKAFPTLCYKYMGHNRMKMLSSLKRRVFCLRSSNFRASDSLRNGSQVTLFEP